MTNPFEVLGVPARFDLDQAELHRRFIALSAANHPDRFLDPLAQADAAGRAAQINGAYKVLAEPQSRAEALLAVLEGPGAAEDKSLPADLLATMMTAREEMDQAVAAGDEPTLSRLRAWAQEQRGKLLAQVAGLFAQTGDLQRGPAARREVRLTLNALRYFQRMLEQF
jgi:molecular chaperone HscB